MLSNGYKTGQIERSTAIKNMSRINKCEPTPDENYNFILTLDDTSNIYEDAMAFLQRDDMERSPEIKVEEFEFTFEKVEVEEMEIKEIEKPTINLPQAFNMFSFMPVDKPLFAY
jgi:hypothetical protein